MGWGALREVLPGEPLVNHVGALKAMADSHGRAWLLVLAMNLYEMPAFAARVSFTCQVIDDENPVVHD